MTRDPARQWRIRGVGGWVELWLRDCSVLLGPAGRPYALTLVGRVTPEPAPTAPLFRLGRLQIELWRQILQPRDGNTVRCEKRWSPERGVQIFLAGLESNPTTEQLEIARRGLRILLGQRRGRPAGSDTRPTPEQVAATHQALTGMGRRASKEDVARALGTSPRSIDRAFAQRGLRYPEIRQKRQ